MVTVNQNGVDVDVLNEVPGAPAPSVTISLDRAVQNAAQDAVNTTGKQGDDRGDQAVDRRDPGRRAERGRRRATGPLATTGLYPPGSTFKIITAGAAIDRDMATPNTLLGCPGTHRHRPAHDPELRRVRPRHGADVAGVRQFVQHHLRRTGQQDAAARPDARPPRSTASGPTTRSTGITTVTGSVPPTVNLAERTEDGFGQGKVLVSPFGMALAAATVAAGKRLCRN